MLSLTGSEKEVPRRVIFVSSVRLIRTSVVEALQTKLAATHVINAGSLEELQRIWTPGDVALIDAKSITLKHEIAIAAAGRMVILGLTVADSDDVIGWVAAGATVYIPDSASDSDVSVALALAARGEVKCPQEFLTILVRKVPRIAEAATASEVPRLTQRETQVAALIGRGLTNQEIADELGVSLSTVKNHVHSILKRVRARGRVEVGRAIRTRPELLLRSAPGF